MTRTIYADDCLKVLNDQNILPSNSVDLIYLDPPFNSKSTYNLPFKGKYKNVKPVKAFTDTWTWGDRQDEYLTELEEGFSTEKLADIVKLAQKIENQHTLRKVGASLSAYLINMTVRLIPMKRILKDTGSIYLHCGPTASHYLKLVLDAVFGGKCFQNEIIWYYRGAGVPKSDFARRHDVIFRYTKKADNYYFDPNPARQPYAAATVERFSHYIGNVREGQNYGEQALHPEGKHPDDVFTDIQPIAPSSKQRLGYPTQKPIELLQRIIEVSSKEGDLVLDPFCGCGTTVHAAEALKRNWIGIDISNFSAGLIRERLRRYFPALSCDDIETHGTPFDMASAKALAEKDKFEFEKWVCGAIGAHGMFHDPGDKGPDGGVDGVIEFGLFKGLERKVGKAYAIVQVKGGKVTPDAVRALGDTVRRFGAAAGILVCFSEYIRTVENNRNKEKFEDLTGTYQVIQGFTIEQLLNDERPKLPPLTFRKDAKMKGDILGQGVI